MTACHATFSTNSAWKKQLSDHGAGGMGERCQNPFETAAAAKLLEGIPPSLPTKPVIDRQQKNPDAVTSFTGSLSKTGNVHCEKEGQMKAATLVGITSSAGACDGGQLNRSNNNTKKDIKDLEAAKDAVVFMGVPELLVQLVIDMEPLEPSLAFSNAQELYHRAHELLIDPQRQYDLFKKQHQQQQQQQQQRQASERPGVNDLEEKCRGGGGGSSSRAEGACQNIYAGMPEGSRQSSTAASSSSSPSASSSFTAAGATGVHPLETTRAPVGTSATSSKGACKQLTSGCFSSKLGKAQEAAATVAPRQDARARQQAASQASAQQEEAGNEEALTTKVAEHIEAEENLHKATSNNSNAQNAEQQKTPSGKTASSSSKKEQLRKKVRGLAEENWRLTQRKLCRACKQVELSSSGVTFLPCGHFITCEVCSEKFDHCPACGKVIMGTVRTFLS